MRVKLNRLLEDIYDYFSGLKFALTKDGRINDLPSVLSVLLKFAINFLVDISIPFSLLFAYVYWKDSDTFFEYFNIAKKYFPYVFIFIALFSTLFSINENLKKIAMSIDGNHMIYTPSFSWIASIQIIDPPLSYSQNYPSLSLTGKRQCTVNCIGYGALAAVRSKKTAIKKVNIFFCTQEFFLEKNANDAAIGTMAILKDKLNHADENPTLIINVSERHDLNNFFSNDRIPYTLTVYGRSTISGNVFNVFDFEIESNKLWDEGFMSENIENLTAYQDKRSAEKIIQDYSSRVHAIMAKFGNHQS